MTASVDSSKTATTDREKGHGPEVLIGVKVVDASAENDGNVNETAPSPWEVTLEKSEDPKNLATWHKWAIVMTVSSGTLCVTCATSMPAFAEVGLMKEFDVSRTVAILPVSLFLMGVGTGPMVIGPLSEVYGRNPLYHGSFTGFFIFSWLVAFAPNVALLITSRFITGFFSAAFHCVTAGTIGDLFTSSEIGNPTTIYTITRFLGPVLGPLISGFINHNLNWRWTYHVTTIWVFVVLIALLFIRETYVPILLKRKAVRLRKETGDQCYHAPMEKEGISLLRLSITGCCRPFQLLLCDRMVLLLDIWNALILGILYLAFQAFPIILGHHGFSQELVGLNFLGIGVGMIVAGLSQPLWNRLALREIKEYGTIRPEFRLIMGQVGGVLIPISLFSIAFTTYPSIHWIVPIIASIPFGVGLHYSFTSTSAYFITAYQPIAASALASNSFVRSCFGSVFPLFTLQMYDALGTVGATTLVAGLATLFAPLPFIFYKIGARLRAQSKFAAH